MQRGHDLWMFWEFSHRSLRIFGTALIGLTLWAGSSGAETVRLGCVEFPPLSFTDSRGKAAGRAVDLLSGILYRQGIDVDDSGCLPGARLMNSLKDGSVHVAMLIRHPDLADGVLYGSLPMTYLDLDAYHLPGRAYLGSMQAVTGRSLILMRGYGYGGWIDFFRDPANGNRVSYADNRQTAFRMLAQGHGDYLIDYRHPVELTIKDNGKVERESLTRLETFFVVSRKAPDADNLLRRIEEEFLRQGAHPVE